MNNKRGKSVTGILCAENIGKAAVFIFLLLLATTFVASAQPCDHNVRVLDVCCKDETTAGWFYYETTSNWEYSSTDHTVLFHLRIDGDDYHAYCIHYEIALTEGDTFNASIYSAEPTCKNNSMAYILNNWAYGCAHCENVSAGQSAIWYFWNINESFCSLGAPKYNHTATPTDPGWESHWIPDCTAHQEACDFINASINESVPYKITTSPITGRFPKGTPIELESTVYYCGEEIGEEVTVVFEADTCTFSESGTNVYENKTINGKAKATLSCDASVDSANVTARVKDMKWFEIVEPCNGYQGTLRIINITDDAAFRFYAQGEVDGYVYEDKNCNCVYDDEPGVPDVTVWLYNDSTGLVNMTTPTNASGYYLFTNVTPGDYWVRYNVSDLPPHLSPKCDDDSGTDAGIPAIITSNTFGVPEGGRHTHNFGVNSSANITIVKRVNGKKQINASLGETVTFTLNVTNTGEVSITNLTVIDVLPIGLSWANDAVPGEDSVTVNPDITTTIVWKNNLTAELPPGGSFVIAFNATVHPILAIPGSVLNNSANVTGESDWGDVYDEDEAYVYVPPLPRIYIVSGFVYEDRNCNCIFDPVNEPWVENVTVVLVNATSGLPVNTTKTSSSGFYIFNNITAAGSYLVRYNVSDLPAHLSPKCDDDGGSANESYPFNLSDDTPMRTHDFGVKSIADVGIEKLVDGVKTKRVLRNQTVTYTLNITNAGDVNLTNITVVDLLPADITWADAANPVQDSVTPNPNGTTTIVWKSNLTVYPFEPGESFEITFNATVNESAVCDKLYENRATVNATSDWGPAGPRRDHADVYLTTEKVPVLTPFGIAALIGLLSLFAVLSIKRKRE